MDKLPVIPAAAVVSVLLFATASVRAATLEGTVTIDGRPAAHAVVYLQSPDGAPTAAPQTGAVMDQKNLAFVPDVLPVVRGTTVKFTNSDDVQHNVFSPSKIAGEFNLGTYGPGAARTVTLNQPGDVLVLCNIHMEMEAHILVLDDPYFSTAQNGNYRIPDVPEGTYTLKIWHGRWLPFAQAVTVPATGTLTANIAAGK